MNTQAFLFLVLLGIAVVFGGMFITKKAAVEFSEAGHKAQTVGPSNPTSAVVFFFDYTDRNIDKAFDLLLQVRGLYPSAKIVMRELPSSARGEELARLGLASRPYGIYHDIYAEIIRLEAQNPNATANDVIQNLPGTYKNYTYDLGSSENDKTLLWNKVLAFFLGIKQTPALMVNGTVLYNVSNLGAIERELNR